MEETPRHKSHHTRKRRTIYATIISAAIAGLYYFTNPTVVHTGVLASPGSAIVTHAVDGDTLDVTIDGHRDIVRLIGVDTPETHDPRKPVQCFGQAAAAHTKELSEGQTVRLEADSQDSNRDKYHRLLRYVYLPNGTLLNSELIQDGYGFAYTIFPFEKLNQFRQFEHDARIKNRGLWAGCQVNSSSQIKQTQNH